MANWNNEYMGAQPKKAMKLSRAIADAIKEIMEQQGVTENQLALRSGVSQPRVNRCLKYERPLYVDEVQAFSEVLGVSVIQMVRRAEEMLGVASRSMEMPRGSDVGVDPNNPFYVAQTQERLARVLRSDYVPAAKHHTEEN